MSAGDEGGLVLGDDYPEDLLAFMLEPLHCPAVSITKLLGHGVHGWTRHVHGQRYDALIIPGIIDGGHSESPIKHVQ